MKIQIYLFIYKQVVSLQVCCTLIYPNEFSRFSFIRTLVQQKISVPTITFSSDIAIIVQRLSHNMDVADLSVFCVSSCRHFVRIVLN